MSYSGSRSSFFVYGHFPRIFLLTPSSSLSLFEWPPCPGYFFLDKALFLLLLQLTLKMENGDKEGGGGSERGNGIGIPAFSALLLHYYTVFAAFLFLPSVCGFYLMACTNPLSPLSLPCCCPIFCSLSVFIQCLKKKATVVATLSLSSQSQTILSVAFLFVLYNRDFTKFFQATGQIFSSFEFPSPPFPSNSNW